MKKLGILSLIYYVLCMLGGVYGAFVALSIKSEINSGAVSSEGWGAIGAAFVYVLGMVFAAVGIVGLIGFIFKLIHLTSGKALFGVLCVFIDVAFIIVVIVAGVPSAHPTLLIPAFSALFNLLSLKD